MSKKLKVVIGVVVMTCFASSFVSAETIATDTAIQTDNNDKVEQTSVPSDLVTEDGFKYQVNNKTITITGYKGDKTEISIPSEIDGKSVTEIGSVAFYGCSSLTEVTIPEGVTSIEMRAFSRCSSLKEIKIPAGVTKIREEVFSKCSSLKEINVDEKNEKYASENGVLYDKEKTTLIICPEGKKEVKIPEEVTSIRYNAFLNCCGLEKIKIPEGITEIQEYTFFGCNKLTIYGEENSCAQNYANKHNIPFKLSSEYDKDISKNDPVTKKYTVKFLNEDGTQIGDVQEVEEGKTAIAPANPTKEGYTFKGWDKDFSNVTSNIEVKAIFEKNAEQDKTDKPQEPEEPGSTVTPPSETDVPGATITPSKDNGQSGNELANPNPPKGDDGENKGTADATSMAGIFTMLAGLIGTIGFRRKNK